MASPNVQVDIVVGKNTVVPALDATTAAMRQATQTSGALGIGMDRVTRGAVKKAEDGFKMLAFQAAGVPGPLGKIAEGALLLGGGSGALLGVAAAAGAVALAWKALSAEGEKVKTLLKDLNDLLPKNDPAATKVAEGWKKYGDMIRKAGELEAKAARPGAMFSAPGLLADAAALRAKAAAMKQLLDAEALTVTVMGGVEKPAASRAAKDSTLDYRMAAGLTGGPQLAALASSTVALRNTIIDPLQEMPAQVGNAFVDIGTEFLKGLSLVQDTIDAINAALLTGFADLGIALADALGGGGNFGQIIVGALGKMMEDIGHLLIQFGVQLTILQPLLSNLLTSGPAMIAAGVLISAAGAAVSKRAQGLATSGGAANSRAVSGGVYRNQYGSDQRGLAPRGTLTVTMPRGAIMRAGDPEWQEFLAETMKAGQGRNVEYKYV